MTKYTALAVTTNYWKPHSNYTDKILNAIEDKVENGDFVVVSEKAISTALGNMVDESTVKPSLTARVLAGFWMRVVWGYPLGILCGFGPRLLKRLRNYPLGVWQSPQTSIVEVRWVLAGAYVWFGRRNRRLQPALLVRKPTT